MPLTPHATACPGALRRLGSATGARVMGAGAVLRGAVAPLPRRLRRKQVEGGDVHIVRELPAGSGEPDRDTGAGSAGSGAADSGDQQAAG